MIIAIDGPAGSGKSTIAREVARRFGFTKLDTGALYRTVALRALCTDTPLDDEDALGLLARGLNISFGPERDGNVTVLADGEDVSAAIRTPEVDRSVSAVSSCPAVRRALLDVQRACAQDADVVAEGRDIGTVVFPDAELKVFLTADARERARRRVLQRHEGEDVASSRLEREIAETLADIERRDALDSSRAAAPLTCAEDAVRIDSTSHTVDEIVDMVGALIESRRNTNR